MHEITVGFSVFYLNDVKNVEIIDIITESISTNHFFDFLGF